MKTPREAPPFTHHTEADWRGGVVSCAFTAEGLDTPQAQEDFIAACETAISVFGGSPESRGERPQEAIESLPPPAEGGEP